MIFYVECGDMKEMVSADSSFEAAVKAIGKSKEDSFGVLTRVSTKYFCNNPEEYDDDDVFLDTKSVLDEMESYCHQHNKT